MAVDWGAQASISRSGEGERVWFLGTLATIRIPGEAVAGRYALIEFVLRYASPPLHTHPQDESYIVLEGQLALVGGDQRFQLTAGDTAAVPIGVAHAFRVDTLTAKVLVLAPGWARTHGSRRVRFPGDNRDPTAETPPAIARATSQDLRGPWSSEPRSRARTRPRRSRRAVDRWRMARQSRPSFVLRRRTTKWMSWRDRPRCGSLRRT